MERPSATDEATGDAMPPATGRPPARWAVAVPAALSAVAATLVLVATRDGLGTTPDGVSYLGAATNLAAGRGLTGPFTTMVDPFTPTQGLAFGGEVPFIQWPPLYPLLLGVGAVLGVDPETVARLLSAVGLAATVGGVAWIVGRLAPRAWPAALVAGLWVLLSPHAALLHVLVASEHLFLALSLGSLWATSRWLAGATCRGATWPWALLSVGLAAAATLTRFVGAAAVVAVAVGVLALGVGPWPRRLGRAAAVGVVGLGPAVAWSQVTARAAGVPTRTLAWHPPDRVQWESVVDTVLGWVSPADTAPPWRLLVGAVTVAALAVAAWGWRQSFRADERGPDQHRPRPPELVPWLVVAGTFVITYLVAVVATHALFDRAVPIGQRLLLPVQPPLAVTVAVGVVGAWRAAARHWVARRRHLAVAASVAAVLVVAVPLRASWWPLVEPGRPWPADPATTPTGQWLTDEPAVGAPLASNDPALAWYSSGRTTIALPVRTSAPTGLDNERFAEDLEALVVGLEARDGVAVVYGTSAYLNPHVANAGDLEGVGFVEVARFDDAVVLAPPSLSPGRGPDPG